jgi:FkbM family methyltransferase
MAAPTLVKVSPVHPYADEDNPVSLRDVLRATVAPLAATPAATRLRAFLRRSAFGRRLLGLVWHAAVRQTEGAFDREMFTTVRPGDVVWDIGANVGDYTGRFAAAVGPDGAVVAVEPAPASAAACRALGMANVRVVERALSDAPGEAPFVADGKAPTNRLDAGGGERVRVTTGDLLMAECGPPNVVKIDVEGYEVEALRGMSRVLASPGLRAVFVEVHFGLLDRREVRGGGRQVEALLSGAGFRVRWVDFSHVAAEKA